MTTSNTIPTDSARERLVVVYLRPAPHVDVLPQARARRSDALYAAVEHVEGDRYRVRGDLTIKETAVPVELDARVRGTGTDAWGSEKIAIRFDGAIQWGPTRVELTAEVSAARQ